MYSFASFLLPGPQLIIIVSKQLEVERAAGHACNKMFGFPMSTIKIIYAENIENILFYLQFDQYKRLCYRNVSHT